MPKRTQIVLCLIQCGATLWDAERRVHGSTDLPLSEVGRRAIIDELPRLASVRAAVVHHANDEAATDTANLCAERMHADTKVDDQLADPNLGLLEGLSQRDFEDRFPSRHRQWEDHLMTLAPPEGEPLPHAARRLFRTVSRILKRSRGEEAAIVMHDIGAGLLRAWLADRPLVDLWPLARNRPHVERYVVPKSMLPALERAADDLPEP